MAVVVLLLLMLMLLLCGAAMVGGGGDAVWCVYRSFGCVGEILRRRAVTAEAGGVLVVDGCGW